MRKLVGTLVLGALSIVSAKALEAQSTTMSVDDTVTYINDTLHKYPTLEFVNAGCPGFEQTVSISEDRRSLVIQQIVGSVHDGTCNRVQTAMVPVFHLNLVPLGMWSKQAQHSSFRLDCVDRLSCFSYHTDAHSYEKSENQWFLRMTAPDVVSDRLQKAIHHLVEGLLAESVVRAGTSDSFSKPTH